MPGKSIADEHVDTETGEVVEPSPPADPTPEQSVDILDLDPRGWKPTPGEKLWGWVLDTETVQSEFGPYPLVKVASDSNELINLHCFHTVLRRTVTDAPPAYGDRIGVKYKGRKTSGGFNDAGYEDYNVVVIPQDRLPAENRLRLPSGMTTPALDA